MNNKFTQKVTNISDGKRLDEFSAEAFNISKSQAQKLIKERLILLNGTKSIPKKKVVKNDMITYLVNKRGKDTIIPIIFEDDCIIVVNKPSGITVHPASSEKNYTVTEIMSGAGKVFPVHRLDKGTSGVMLLAKTAKIHKTLQDQFRERTVVKEYLALLEGRIVPENGLIDIPLGREEQARNKIGPKSGGRSAKTQYEVKECLKDYSYVSAYPKTGRTHQIRVHFSALGFPVVGDIRYGAKSKVSKRVFLHSHLLSFIHPKTGKLVTYKAELPDDLQEVLTKLK